jgi:hypothetical protein
VPSVVPPRLVRIIDMRGGGAEGTRTPDPHTASVVLSQLSYSPACISFKCVTHSTALVSAATPAVLTPGAYSRVPTFTAAIHTGEFGHIIRHFHHQALASRQPTTPMVQPRLQGAILAERDSPVNRSIAATPSPNPSPRRGGGPEGSQSEPPPGALWAVSGGGRGWESPAITSNATGHSATRRRKRSGAAPCARTPRASARRRSR